MKHSGEIPDGVLDLLGAASTPNVSEGAIGPATTTVLVPLEPASPFDFPAVYVAVCILVVASVCLAIIFARWTVHRKPTRRDRRISSFEQVSTYL
ncbi:hypothetical protein QR680_017283 [Steinernema hermaphroditum]|uniref:Uncharacterized protein n=1 Tax=Steinernema hermaphroditum TaxID=289476 RepID=A0AA39LNQ7_9BILA|nr:hypothetical protein QR680_017283 [Steinernema hermaphroditum]